MKMAKMRINITFPEDLIKDPIIYNLGKMFDIITNIRRANVEQEVGWVVLEIEGTDEALRQGLAYLDEAGVRVDQLDGDVIES